MKTSYVNPLNAINSLNPINAKNHFCPLQPRFNYEKSRLKKITLIVGGIVGLSNWKKLVKAAT